MKLELTQGVTSKRIVIFIQDASKTTGVGLTGLTSASSGLIWYYYREDSTAATAITPTTESLGTWTSAGFVEISATHMPGMYEIGVPNAVLAATNSPTWAVMQLSGATNMVPVNIEIQLNAFNLTTATQPTNVIQWNGTAVATPNIGGVPKVDVTDWLGTAVTAVTGGVPDVNVKNFNNHTAQTDANNLPKVDVEDFGGAAGTFTSGVPNANASTNVNVTQWSGTNVATPNLGGVPLIDVKYVLGTIATAATGGVLDVNVKNYNNHAALTDTNNLPKVDVEDFGGTAGTFTSGIPNVNAAASTNVNVVQWNGTNIATPNVGGVPVVDVKYWLGTLVLTPTTGGQPKVETVVNDDKTGYGLTQTFPTNFSSLAISTAGAVNLAPQQLTVKKNSSITFTFPMFSATTGALQTGLTVVSQRTIDGGAINTTTNSPTEVGDGLYSLVLAAGDLNGTCITLILTATGAQPQSVTFITQA